MPEINSTALAALMERLPQDYPGPGGLAAVVHEGRVIAQRVWGYADLNARLPMADDLRFPVCSITKQFTCAAVLGEVGSFDALDPMMADLLPNFRDDLPLAVDLANNQSGLRDYWALTILQGAYAEAEFPRAAAAPLIARNKTGHFAAGHGYSYSNGNFRMLADLLERASGKAMADLYRTHIWGPAGMAGAVLASDTRTPTDGLIGYEGNPQTGYWPAQNGIWWMGDAGMAASLRDMIAYETWIDANRADPQNLYQRIAQRQSFMDGKPAYYGMGLQHHTVGGQAFTGHGGALRGYRSFRMYAPEARLSVVVMFNHQSDAHGAGQALARAALGGSLPAALPNAAALAARWEGQWLCPQSGLMAWLRPMGEQVVLQFATAPERLSPQADGSLAGGSTRITPVGDNLRLQRGAENYDQILTPLAPLAGLSASEIMGRWHSPELEADMVVDAEGVWFDGLLGQGPVELLRPVAQDVWYVQTRRSMDAPAPGDWTLRAERDAAGAICALVLSVWLARDIRYTPKSTGEI